MNKTKPLSPPPMQTVFRKATLSQFQPLTGLLNESARRLKLTPRSGLRLLFLVVLMASVIGLSSRLKADTAICGGQSLTLPFSDVAAGNLFFCAITEAYFSGLMDGVSATTFKPGSSVKREDLADVASRMLAQAVKRSSRRAALRQFWTPQTASNLGLTTVAIPQVQFVECDGADLWVSSLGQGQGTVSRVRASDGRLLQTWHGAFGAQGVLCAMGKVFVAGGSSIYQIDPTQNEGPVSTLISGLGVLATAIAFDGERIWTTNEGPPGSVSIVTLNPLSVTNVTTGFILPKGLLYDGANIWITDEGDNTLKKLDASGNILLSVTVGTEPQFPAFDGTNIWVPNHRGGMSVVRATGPLAGTVLATLLSNPAIHAQAAFDGERILVTNLASNTVSVWKASDMSPIGRFPTGVGTRPFGVCSDGVNFWIALRDTGQLARF